jgi:serine/threonine-protein kinase
MLNIGDFGIATLTKTDNAGDDIIPGFAAPEIYNEKAETGNFTEVYAVAAVIYNVLTSTVPPSATERLSGAYLTPPMRLNPSVPEAISDLICKAMELNGEERIKSVRGFIELLEAVDIGEEVPEKVVEVKKSGNSKKKAVIVWSLVAAAMLCLIIMIFVILLGGTRKKPAPPPVFSSSQSSSDEVESSDVSSVSSESPLESSPDNRYYATIDCVGKSYSDITKNMDYLLRFSFEPTYEYSDEFKEGVVIKQEPQPDEPLAYMGTIKVVVSKGPQFYELPRFAGKTLEEYKEKLYEIGLTDDNLTFEESDNFNALPGYVSNVIVTAGGDKIDVEKLSETKLLIFYKANDNTESSENKE